MAAAKQEAAWVTRRVRQIGSGASLEAVIVAMRTVGIVLATGAGIDSFRDEKSRDALGGPFTMNSTRAPGGTPR